MCPHCGFVTAGDASSVFLTHALSANEESDFWRQEGNEISALPARVDWQANAKPNLNY